eukprot:6212805-Pleurochrysis_carterae.AAC.3
MNAAFGVVARFIQLHTPRIYVGASFEGCPVNGDCRDEHGDPVHAGEMDLNVAQGPASAARADPAAQELHAA